MGTRTSGGGRTVSARQSDFDRVRSSNIRDAALLDKALSDNKIGVFWDEGAAKRQANFIANESTTSTGKTLFGSALRVRRNGRDAYVAAIGADATETRRILRIVKSNRGNGVAYSDNLFSGVILS